MRKVANRLAVLEERYKDLNPQTRAAKINAELKEIFCVGVGEIKEWKRIVNVMKSQCGDIPTLPPSHYSEIAKLPEEKQKEVIQEVAEKKLTYQQTALLVDKVLGKESPPLPKGQFDIIYADPPWQYEVNFLSASPDSHYRTLSTEEICTKQVLTTENAVLFLWATNPMLEDALKVMKAWGFTYKTNMVWVKDKIGLGFYFRGQHELLLVGVKGKVAPPTEELRVSSVFSAPAEQHSRKPRAIRTMIEKLYPNSKRTELYATEKAEGWTSWGNEL
jgi:N6-adenosine-specific RNA methylase IME4